MVNIKINNTIFYKESSGWPSLEIIKRLQEMDCAYQSLKDFDKTHKDFDDYTKKNIKDSTEYKILNLPLKISPTINLTTSSLTDDVYIIRSHQENFKSDLDEYCEYARIEISKLEVSLVNNNVFIAAYEVDDYKKIYISIKKEYMKENYNLEGYIEYPFFSEKYCKYIKYKYSFYISKTDLTKKKIVVLTEDNNLVCSNLFKENSMYYKLINRLLNFQSYNRSVCCYEYSFNDKKYVLFSRYTKKELKDLCLDPVILESLIEVEFFRDNDILTFLPIAEYVRKRNTELKIKFGPCHEKVIRSKSQLSGKYMDDLIPGLYETISSFESVYSSDYVRLYTLPGIKIDDIIKEIDLIDQRKLDIEDDYIKDSKNQLLEVEDIEETKKYINIKEKFIEKILITDEYNELLEQMGLTKCDFEIISNNYLIGKSSIEKPTFYTHYDYVLYGEKCMDRYYYIPEIFQELNKSNINIKLYEKKKKPELLLDFKVLARRPCIIGKDEILNPIRDICNNFYIINPFYDSQRLNFQVPKYLRWSFFLNKFYINLLFNRELLFPIIYLYTENKDKYLYFINFDLELVGYIQIKIKNNIDKIIFIFYDKNSDNEQYKYFNFRANRIIINQGINDFIRWMNIELNILYYTNIKNNNLHIYKSTYYGKLMYLFSKKKLHEIQKYYSDNKLDSCEIEDLTEVKLVKDPITKLFKFEKNMTGGEIIIKDLKINEKKNENKYEPSLLYNKLKKYFFFKDLPLRIRYLLIKEIYIVNDLSYRLDNENIKYDIKMLPYIVNLNSILKNKFICWDKNLEFFFVLNLIKNKSYKKFLSISSNRCCIEPIKFYFDNANITNLNFNKFMYELNIKLVNKIKENYLFNELQLDNINFLENKNFDFIVFDCIYQSQFKNDDYKNYESYSSIEKENIFLINKIYDILKFLKKEGGLLIFLTSFINEETLLVLQFIRKCFVKCKIIKIDKGLRKTEFFSFLFEEFIGIVEPLPYLSNKFMKSINKFYKNLLEDLENEKLRYEMINNNIDNKKYIKSLNIQNLAYSYKFAQDLGFDVYKNIVIDDSDESTYGIDIKKNDILLQSLQKMFSLDEGIYVVMKNRDKNLLVKVTITDDIELPEKITYYNKLQNISIRQIDFRPIHLWDETKKFIRYYEHTLNIYLQKYRISIEKTKPVSRAWIKFYELLFVTKVFDDLKGYLKVFHICEAPGTFIMSTIYYLDRWNRDLKYEWDATTLNPKYLSKNGIGDTYDLLKKYKDKWTFGFDGTGDITVEKNIKHYREMCKDRDFIIGDCGLPWGDDALPGIILYYSQMLFILYNLKDGGGCIFKQILNFQHKILVDMAYLLYYCFDVVKVYKPTQNTFSGEFYIICTGYKKLLKDSDFDILFKVLDDKQNIHKKSILNQEYSKDFIYQFSNSLDKIIVNFNQAIDRQLFYADFWHLIEHEDRDEIKKYIDIKNKDWVETFLLKKS